MLVFYEMAIKNEFQKWCDITSAHGYADLNRSKNWFGKAAWTVLIVISLGCLTSNLYEIITSFIDGKDRWGTTVYQDVGGKYFLKM